MERVLKERILVHAGFYGKTNKIMQNSVCVCVRCVRVFILFLLSKCHLNRIFIISKNAVILYLLAYFHGIFLITIRLLVSSNMIALLMISDHL
jgi:hypothetical protein